MSCEAPRVSVVMTVHNGEAYLAEAVECVLAQTLPAFELIVVDDLSDDATPALLAGYAARDPRVRILRNTANLGPYPSANRAMDMARAPLIARLDADDACTPDRLARQVEFLDAHPDHALVASSYRSIDAAGHELYVKRNPMDAWQTRWTSRFRMPSVHSSFCFRAALPDGTPVRYETDAPFSQDYALIARLAHAAKAAVLEDVLTGYRMHDANITTTRPSVQKARARAVSERYLRAHYPAEIADGIGAMLDVHHRLRSPDRAALRAADAALRAVVHHDDDGAPGRRAWLERRCAAMLAEAFVHRRPLAEQLRGAALFASGAPAQLAPLARRLSETRGWIAAPGAARC